jgi:adenosylcobinamide-phosphate synthase
MFIVNPLFFILIIIAAVILDYSVGEPRRWHPLIAFAALATRIESIFYSNTSPSWGNRLRGSLAVLVIVLLLLIPLLMLEKWLAAVAYPGFIISTVVVYFCIAPRSLREHARAVAQPLMQKDLAGARKTLSYIVSRDVDLLSEQEIAAASCESVLENGSDAIFAALFWFCVAGVPGIVAYRAANTLDAMWGYKNDRYRYFGWAAAKLDDGLNWFPARLVAFSYALLGNFTLAIRCWREQADHWKSPNAGPVMSAGAGSLNICLGGPAVYHGKVQSRPVLGSGSAATVDDIERALTLVDRTLLLWLFVLALLSLMLSL